MKRTDPAIMERLRSAFYVAHKRHALPGVWCTDEAILEIINEFSRSHGEPVWRVYVPEGLTAPPSYAGAFSLEHCGFYAEIEDKSLVGESWTAYVIGATEESEWVKMPGSPYSTKEAAAAAVERYIQNENRDLDSGVVGGGRGAESVGTSEALTGGTREYLTRGT